MRERESERIRIFPNSTHFLRQVVQMRASNLSPGSCFGFLQSCLQVRQKVQDERVVVVSGSVAHDTVGHTSCAGNFNRSAVTEPQGRAARLTGP